MVTWIRALALPRWFIFTFPLLLWFIEIIKSIPLLRLARASGNFWLSVHTKEKEGRDLAGVPRQEFHQSGQGRLPSCVPFMAVYARSLVSPLHRPASFLSSWFLPPHGLSTDVTAAGRFPIAYCIFAGCASVLSGFPPLRTLSHSREKDPDWLASL